MSDEPVAGCSGSAVFLLSCKPVQLVRIVSLVALYVAHVGLFALHICNFPFQSNMLCVRECVNVPQIICNVRVSSSFLGLSLRLNLCELCARESASLQVSASVYSRFRCAGFSL